LLGCCVIIVGNQVLLLGRCFIVAGNLSLLLGRYFIVAGNLSLLLGCIFITVDLSKGNCFLLSTLKLHISLKIKRYFFFTLSIFFTDLIFFYRFGWNSRKFKVKSLKICLGKVFKLTSKSILLYIFHCISILYAFLFILLFYSYVFLLTIIYMYCIWTQPRCRIWICVPLLHLIVVAFHYLLLE